MGHLVRAPELFCKLHHGAPPNLWDAPRQSAAFLPGNGDIQSMLQVVGQEIGAGLSRHWLGLERLSLRFTQQKKRGRNHRLWFFFSSSQPGACPRTAGEPAALIAIIRDPWRNIRASLVLIAFAWCKKNGSGDPNSRVLSQPSGAPTSQKPNLRDRIPVQDFRAPTMRRDFLRPLRRA